MQFYNRVLLLPLSWLLLCFSVWNVLRRRCYSGRPLCILLWFVLAARETQNYRSYLFINFLLQPLFRTAALFPKLSAVLELNEYWLVEIMKALLAHIWSQQTAHFSVHIKVLYQSHLRNYWSLRDFHIRSQQPGSYSADGGRIVSYYR